MIFRLHKPLYDWAWFEETKSHDLDLSDEVKEWLDRRKIKYDAYPLTEKCDIGEGLHTYLFFYIDIWDKREAMLFKLTWM